VTLLAPAAVKSGDVVVVGALVGIAQYDAVEGGEVETMVEGVHELPKGNAAITAGAKAYWDAANKVCTATATGNTLLGAAILSAGADATTCRVRLNGIA
jgi:predicted RecA/RadA family phage recombinase